MVCFEILFGLPLYTRESMNLAFQARFDHLRKHYNGDRLNSWINEKILYTRVRICDEDGVSLLRDVPRNTFCVSVKVLYTDHLLYSNGYRTGVQVVPPKDLLFKRVYWTAMSLEKWQPPTAKLLKPK